MHYASDDKFVVRTPRVEEPSLWAWEIVESATGRIVEDSWSAQWLAYVDRDAAERAGRARLAAFTDRDAIDTAATRKPTRRSVLLIVPRTRTTLYQEFKRSFGSNATTEVILDRRFRDRRVRAVLPEAERRTADRRCRADIDALLKSGRTVTVRISPSSPTGIDRDARAFLWLCCSQHAIRCAKCRNTFRLDWLPHTDAGLFSCPLCGYDVTLTVSAHTKTCWCWMGRRAGRKPLAKVDSSINDDGLPRSASM